MHLIKLVGTYNCDTMKPSSAIQGFGILLVLCNLSGCVRIPFDEKCQKGFYIDRFSPNKKYKHCKACTLVCSDGEELDDNEITCKCSPCKKGFYSNKDTGTRHCVPAIDCDSEYKIALEEPTLETPGKCGHCWVGYHNYQGNPNYACEKDVEENVFSSSSLTAQSTTKVDTTFPLKGPFKGIEEEQKGLNLGKTQEKLNPESIHSHYTSVDVLVLLFVVVGFSCIGIAFVWRNCRKKNRESSGNVEEANDTSGGSEEITAETPLSTSLSTSQEIGQHQVTSSSFVNTNKNYAVPISAPDGILESTEAEANPFLSNGENERNGANALNQSENSTTASGPTCQSSNHHSSNIDEETTVLKTPYRSEFLSQPLTENDHYPQESDAESSRSDAEGEVDTRKPGSKGEVLGLSSSGISSRRSVEDNDPPPYDESDYRNSGRELSQNGRETLEQSDQVKIDMESSESDAQQIRQLKVQSTLQVHGKMTLGELSNLFRNTLCELLDNDEINKKPNKPYSRTSFAIAMGMSRLHAESLKTADEIIQELTIKKKTVQDVILYFKKVEHNLALDELCDKLLECHSS